MKNEHVDDLVRKLSANGLSIKKIAKTLKISRNTVRRILREDGTRNRRTRSDAKGVPLEVLSATHTRCEGWAERTHEELLLAGYNIGYSTLTRLLRETTSPRGKRKIASYHGDVPGEEFQHDTSPEWVKISGTSIKLQLSSLYFRFSKIIYIRFYPFFRRFEMQCFLHEALMDIGYSCNKCIIDNTNLAVLKGTGKDAVMVPEMAELGRTYGFQFIAHELNHSDRKGGVEKSISTVKSNFLPGRTFETLEDLNEQARKWSHDRRQKKLEGGVPSELLDLERPFLKVVPPMICPPYQELTRKSDQYGFVAYQTNFYWAGLARTPLDILVYSDHLDIYQKRKKLYGYPLSKFQESNKKFLPDEMKAINLSPSKGSTHRRVESELRGVSSAVKDYLDASHGQFRTNRSRQAFVRRLETLAKRIDKDIFLTVVASAHEHGIYDSDGVERLAALELKRKKIAPRPIQHPSIGEFEHREAYQKLKKTAEPDAARYHRKLKKETEE